MQGAEQNGIGSPVSEFPRGSRAAVGEFDAALMQNLERHLADEQVILDEYRALAESTDEPVRYIAQLILDDEERHHRVLTEMLNQFRTSVWLAEQTPHVPWLTRSHDRRALKASVRRLRAFERRDLHELRRLNRRFRFLRRDSLNGVLVRALIIDTRKHLLYLRTLNRLTRRR
jgi:hypothetical protein